MNGAMSHIGTDLPIPAVKKYGRFLGYSSREMLAVRLSHSDPNRSYARLTNGRAVERSFRCPLTDLRQFDILQSGPYRHGT